MGVENRSDEISELVYIFPQIIASLDITPTQISPDYNLYKYSPQIASRIFPSLHLVNLQIAPRIDVPFQQTKTKTKTRQARSINRSANRPQQLN